MAEIRLTVSDDLVNELQAKLGTGTKLTDIAKDAMSLFNWAVGERAGGRVVLSATPQLEDLKQITTPTLDRAKPPSN